jgi:hypothetical protein
MVTTTPMLMTIPPIGMVEQSYQLTIMLVIVHCVGEEGEGKKNRKRTVEKDWLCIVWLEV